MPLNAHRHHRPGLVLGVLLAFACVAWLLPAPARASAPTKVVRYHGYRVRVPSGWPVFRLAGNRRTCVRFNRHAVYLGQPAADQACPTAGVGRTEAILVEQAHGRTLASQPQPLPMPAGPRAAQAPTAAQVIDNAHHVIVTATWSHHPALIRRALGIRNLAAAARRSEIRRPSQVARARALVHGRRRGRATTPASVPGGIYTGSGFDACHTPSPSQMAAWGASPYRAIGVYIGGENMACSQPNLTSTWVSQQSADGWHLIPIYVGLQANPNSCGCQAMSTATATATSQGAADASYAVADAQAIGIGAGNPLYLDMEGYHRATTTSAAVLAYIQGWTDQLHADGYGSGVYSSSNSGMIDLSANYGTAYPEPDDIWIANWNNQQNTADPNVPSTYWTSHQRMHQFDGAHNETYGGVTINIDGDYVDASTAAAGTGTGPATPAPTPSLGVSPAPDGSTKLHPSWLYEPGVASWQILAGQTPETLAPLGAPVAATTKMPIDSDNVFPYFAVTALDAAGQPLGTSAAVATPSHLAVYGQSVFIPRAGLGGVPVGCFNSGPCTGVTVTVMAGRTTLVKTGRERIPQGGGLAFFSLTQAERNQLWKHHRHQWLVKIAVNGDGGLSAMRRVKLTAFSTKGRAPSRSLQPSSGIRLVGLSDFVSSGWVGGILADCISTTPCQTQTKIVSHGQVIAQTGVQTLGVGELGYLMFTLTPAGHHLLMTTVGNQMPARVIVSGAGARAVGQLSLSAYN
ncbi:MAG TPA: DUF1906 domain-containing protein [Solirubrobacteraceae bacterium]|nr:DUF1906 domain-containing protein [Solirubrobacteraceae bacterium]